MVFPINEKENYRSYYFNIKYLRFTYTRIYPRIWFKQTILVNYAEIDKN